MFPRNEHTIKKRDPLEKFNILERKIPSLINFSFDKCEDFLWGVWES